MQRSSPVPVGRSHCMRRIHTKSYHLKSSPTHAVLRLAQIETWRKHVCIFNPSLLSTFHQLNDKNWIRKVAKPSSSVTLKHKKHIASRIQSHANWGPAGMSHSTRATRNLGWRPTLTTRPATPPAGWGRVWCPFSINLSCGHPESTSQSVTLSSRRKDNIQYTRRTCYWGATRTDGTRRRTGFTWGRHNQRRAAHHSGHIGTTNTVQTSWTICNVTAIPFTLPRTKTTIECPTLNRSSLSNWLLRAGQLQWCNFLSGGKTIAVSNYRRIQLPVKEQHLVADTTPRRAEASTESGTDTSTIFCRSLF